VKGSYVLLIRLPEAQTIAIGSLPEIHFSRGYYAYVGSALGGVKARLNRHLNKDKKPHWHIDYLLQKAAITDIISGETKERVECTIAQALSSKFDSIPGFGASDCHCASHLFYATRERAMKSAIVAAMESLNVPIKLGGSRGHGK
jgi:sugar fermentation stimulation protein A